MNPAKEPIKIGKFTLESLTTGMYADPRIIFREYIQNATDAVDNAVKEGLVQQTDGRIDITIDKQNSRIIITDNGVGINHEDVWRRLGDIGDSEKRFEENRGFRGIGRLGGMSYADELQFIAKAKGEADKTIVYWDCKKLKELLQPGKYMDYDLARVIDEISFMTTEKEESNAHYFQVVLEGIDKKYPELLDSENIRDYLSQVAPVSFNAQKFPYAYDSTEGIIVKFKEFNKPEETYNIHLNGDPNTIYKPYKTWFVAADKKDDIQGIEFFHDCNDNNELLFWGWYAKTNWLGTINDKEVKGLRVRKNNIQIGNGDLLNDFFSETRLNGWFIGEVYVYEKNLIPNARRDDFERNEEYEVFRNKLKKITKGVLSKIPHKHSDDRSERKAIDNAERTITEVEDTLKKGITSEVQRKDLYNKLDTAKSKVKPKKEQKPTEETAIQSNEIKKTVFEKLKELEIKVIDADTYRIQDVPSSYSREERKIVRLAFEVIDRNLPEDLAEKVKDDLIKELQINSKENKKNEQKNPVN